MKGKGKKEGSRDGEERGRRGGGVRASFAFGPAFRVGARRVSPLD